jgi:hypothetical protein
VLLLAGQQCRRNDRETAVSRIGGREESGFARCLIELGDKRRPQRWRLRQIEQRRKTSRGESAGAERKPAPENLGGLGLEQLTPPACCDRILYDLA